MLTERTGLRRPSKVGEAAALALALAAAACKSESPAASATGIDGSSAASAAATSGSDRSGIQLVEAPLQGDAVDSIVRAAVARALASKRTLVVYVGAAWCEPCQRFHHAAERGELDAAFPTLTLLEFDLDRDGERLEAAGYVSKYIPLFALPGPDGKASGKQIEGGIKGDGAVAFIVPRLKEMLSD
jgi:thiol-disulfide isomerase/thioredoxin